jgi:hypothetical protein
MKKLSKKQDFLILHLFIPTISFIFYFAFSSSTSLFTNTMFLYLIASYFLYKKQSRFGILLVLLASIGLIGLSFPLLIAIFAILGYVYFLLVTVLAHFSIYSNPLVSFLKNTRSKLRSEIPIEIFILVDRIRTFMILFAVLLIASVLLGYNIFETSQSNKIFLLTLFGLWLQLMWILTFLTAAYDLELLRFSFNKISKDLKNGRSVTNTGKIACKIARNSILLFTEGNYGLAPLYSSDESKLVSKLINDFFALVFTINLFGNSSDKKWLIEGLDSIAESSNDGPVEVIRNISLCIHKAHENKNIGYLLDYSVESNIQVLDIGENFWELVKKFVTAISIILPILAYIQK